MPAHKFYPLLILIAIFGCDKPDPIITYRVPTKIPAELRDGDDRMLAAMVPKGDQVWFFKVTGPESAITSIEATFRSFVENITITDGSPDLSQLPEGWRKGGDKPMRFASIDVDTPGKQLDISISQLGRQDDYDAFVTMNVNRWRNQLSLEPSDEKWAEGTPIKVAAADGESVWIDLIGKSGAGGPAMTPPFASAGSSVPTGPTPPPTTVPSMAIPSKDDGTPPDSRLQFDRPEGWRDGRMSTMRMAAFDVGPEDAPAEITVIPAGGDLRGNVARWLGQVRETAVPDDVVDQAMADALQVDVDGRPGQRFFLAGDDVENGTAIDATIVPLDGGMSLFIKMTGPAPTVTKESEAIASFLKSLKLKL